MPDPTGIRNPGAPIADDSRKQELGFGDGGVPWYLLIVYLAFLVFFTWYALEYQLPDFVEQGPIHVGGEGGEAAR